MMGYPDMVKNGKTMQEKKSYAKIPGRVSFVMEGPSVFFLLLIWSNVYLYLQTPIYLQVKSKTHLIACIFVLNFWSDLAKGGD